MGFEIVKHTPIKSRNLDPNRYTVSLLKEGFRAGLLDKQTVYGIQEQIMLILKDLITRYTKGESTSVKLETAESLLNSIYYAIDAYTGSFGKPEDSIGALKSESIKEIYERGVGLVAAWVAEAKKRYREMAGNKLDVPQAIYRSTVEEALPGFFEKYGVVFNAHDTAADIDYPLVFDDMNVQGIRYIRNYIETLETETQFCRFFDKGAIAKILINYGRIFHVDYAETPVNLFEIVINNSIFSVLLGNSGSQLAVSGFQYGLLKRKLEGLKAPEIEALIGEAVEIVIADLKIDRPKLIDYIHRYKAVFVRRVLNAVENGSLHNLVITGQGERPRTGGIALAEGERMADGRFRFMIRRIMACDRIQDKIDLIASGIHSLEDFIDMLEAECLFGDEFAAVFNTLSDMELAVLAKSAFPGETANGLSDLSWAATGKGEAETGWRAEYVGFLQGLSRKRMKAVAALINGMM